MFSTDGVHGSPASRDLIPTQDRLLACNSGRHELEKILGTGEDGIEICKVVRWCEVCGSVVVDIDLNGRTIPGVMKVSKVAQSAFAEFSLRR